MSKNYQKHIMERANRNLTNYADGATETVILENADPNVDAAIDDFFQFTMANNLMTPVNAAVIPSFYDTERYQISDGAVIKTYDNIEGLRNAGHMVGAVAADGAADYTTSDNVKVDMTCTANDPSKPINDFLRYIKLNPRYVKHMDIICSNMNAWSGSLAVSFCNPFFTNKVQRVNLTTFFSRFQFQTDRIGINFDPNLLEVSDRTLLTTTIPGSASMQFIFTFAN